MLHKSNHFLAFEFSETSLTASTKPYGSHNLNRHPQELQDLIASTRGTATVYLNFWC